MQAPPHRKRSSNAYLAAVFFAPTALIVALGIVLILSLLKSSALQLDQSQQSAERRLAQSVIATLVTTLQRSAADYANWDDMYDQFSTGLDPQWAKENLGPYVVDAFSLSNILVLGADGSVKYSFTTPSEPDGAPNAEDIAAINGLVKSALSSWQPGEVKAVGGALSIHGQPHLVAISPIAVNSETRKARGEIPRGALVFVHGLDDAHLTAIASDFGLSDLRAAMGDEGMLPLIGPLGTPTTLSLTWTNSQLGSRFVADALPPIAFVGAAVILLFIVLGFVWTLIVGRIRQAVVAAEDASRSKSLFIANMTHELRTPLNAIIGFSELMSKETFGPITTPKYREYVLDIVTSGHHLLGIVNNILLFSKVEARRQDMEIKSLDLEHVVSDVARAMRIEADRRNIRLTKAPFPARITIDADPQALKQILFNVIGNAIKFSSPDGEVVLKPAGITPSGTYKLEVIDHGCGIPKKTLSQLGSAFVQADNSFTRKHQGTGLGLAISIGLAESMGASIELESTENVGTTVSILLRVSAGNAEEPFNAEDASQAA